MAGNKGADFSGVTNPRRVLAKREEAADLNNPSDQERVQMVAGRDAGDLPGPAADFFKSGGGASNPSDQERSRMMNKRSGPPADVLKKHYAK